MLGGIAAAAGITNPAWATDRSNLRHLSDRATGKLQPFCYVRLPDETRLAALTAARAKGTHLIPVLPNVYIRVRLDGEESSSQRKRRAPEPAVEQPAGGRRLFAGWKRNTSQ